MTINTARSLLRKPLANMTLECLQRHKVRLLDAARESEAENGFEEAVKNGFYKMICSDSASGFSPTDIWLTHELWYRYEQAAALEQKILNS